MVNLVGKVPPLEASGAAVTLVHPTATTVAGQWDVTYPQDMPEEERPNLGPTRTFGYAHRLVDNPPRFARRHVRRDIQIDARDKNGWSNAESQLDSAARELSGDVVFQRTLTGDDLGVLVPNVDFKQGDVLPLLVWGMIVPATCTSIRYTLEDGRRAVEVGFGPDLQADTAGLAETMSQIDRQMRAEAAGIDEYLAKQLDEAKAASEQQVNGLKTYVDEQDTASRTHADTVAGNALTTARSDAKGYADTAQSQAQAYARRQDVENLKSAKEYAKDQLDEAQEALTKYREQVTGLIGDQGTITTKLDELNKDYTDKLGETGTIIKDIEDIKDNHSALSRDFTNKVGENGTLVKDQRSTSNLIDAMVHGKPHAQLTNTQFQQQQNAVNLMQSEFNKKQVNINTGFQNLFKAQADINTVNSAFQAKQHDLNSGFQALFTAQKFTNEMQQAFNKKQTGINDVYDAMWEQQQQRDLLQEYLIEHNRIMAESRQAHDFEIEVVVKGGKIVRQQVEWDNSGAILWVSTFDGGRVDVELDDAKAYGLLRATTNRSMRWFYSHAATNGYGFQFYFDWGKFSDEETIVTFNGTLFPQTLLPKDSYRLDRLAEEYRKKGLKI